ncbi:MAG: DUF5117 domain-containing protein [Alphaproteobacteria bacterium]|nr:DUF5117 domain-containing protein [Alphaproteobacteria bacterium]
MGKCLVRSWGRPAGQYKPFGLMPAVVSALIVTCSHVLPASAQSNPGWPSIEKVTQKLERIDGFFVVYVDPRDGAAFLEIDEQRLGKDFIGFSYTENGVLEGGHFRGSYRGNSILAFERNYLSINLVSRNTHFYFDPEQAISRAADANITDAVLAALPIIAADESEKGAKYLVEADSLLLTSALHAVNDGGPGGWLGQISDDRTSYREIRNYPSNTDFIVDYVFAKDKPRGRASDAIADPRSVTITMQHSFIEMPPEGYEPRLDDYRIGYFAERVTDLTSRSAAPYRDLINRWRLEKKDPDAIISDPVKPIVWWIENTTPIEFRDAIRDGVLAWNQAFEKAGFSNAIVVNVQPDDADWDAGDIRYNVLRWTSSPNPIFGGYGPRFSNPRTGETLGADIMLEYSFVTNRRVIDQVFPPAGAVATGLIADADFNVVDEPELERGEIPDQQSPSVSQLRRWIGWAAARLPGGNDSDEAPSPDDEAPVSTGEKDKLKNLGIAIRTRPNATTASFRDSGLGFRASGDGERSGENGNSPQSRQTLPADGFCDFANHLSMQLAFGRTALAAAGASDADISRLIEESLYFVALHEVGHTLGLNHNMKASSFFGPREVHDANVTKGAPSASVMDYPAINIAPPGVTQGDYMNTRPGPYDEWAIEFGYQPGLPNPDADQKRRDAILARADRRENAFGNDADAMWFAGIGVDPRVMVGDMSSDPVAYAKDRFNAIDAALQDMLDRYQDQDSWQELLGQFASIQGQRAAMAAVMARQVGGVYVDRRAPEQFDDGRPYVAVPKEKQKAAIKALGETVFAGDALAAPDYLVARLQPQRRGFEFAGRGNEDPKLHDQTLEIQRAALTHLLDSSTLTRLTDSMAYGGDYPVKEMLLDLNRVVFGSDLMGKPNTFRQNLQVEYVLYLRRILGSGHYDTISKSAALIAIDDIQSRMGLFDFWLSAETRAHRKHIRLLTKGV